MESAGNGEKSMEIRFCRDCANFEERRDIDGVALCAENIGPYICCEDFEKRDESINENRFYNRFCVECVNFEDVNGIAVCAKNHTPGIACQAFASRFEKLSVVRQNNHMKTALLIHAVEEKPIPDYLIEISRKIKW